MKRLWMCLLLTLLTTTISSAALEAIVTRVEENGRLLVPVRGVFELTGALVEWNPAEQGVVVTYGGDMIAMWVNSYTAMMNGYEVYLDVPPRNVGGRVHIPLRFVGEALGRAVNYTGTAVYLTAPGYEDIIIYIDDMVQPPPPPAVSGELMPWSNDRSLTNADLAGYTNWQLTLIRNEIYARHGRPFSNANIRAYFNGTGWYAPNTSFREAWLSELERQNAAFIRSYQQRVFGAPATKP